jgi:hypothetical protein
MKWKLALIAVAVFSAACTDNAADGKKLAGAGLKALEDNLAHQISNQPSLRDVLEENNGKWIRVAPGNKSQCMKLTLGILDEGYVRCMNGYEAEVEKLSNGQVHILQIENPTTR